jgi:glycerophosphoryl diester phosphodiesterase
VIVWTVNDPAMARQLAAIGVDGLCSDVVDELRVALQG